MKKSAIQQMPRFFERYIHLVEDIDLLDALKKHRVCPIETDKLHALADQRYAPDKWTVKDILQHIIDTERIMAYRALRFSRNDDTSLPGYEEKLYGEEANGSARSIESLLEEFRVVRSANIMMFQHMTDAMLMRGGESNNIFITTLALGFVIVGHPIHHWSVIRERYFPLLP